MSIFSSMYIGMSGMRTNESAIGVIGNNIANINTIGFKSSRAVFADMLSRTLIGSAGASQAGQGASLAAVQRMVTQGALLGTNVSTDLAIAGDGFFVVEDAQGGRFYTRNGQLQLDNEGYLTTVQGFRLQGYPANVDGVVSTRIGPLRLGELTASPRATEGIAMAVNLDRSAPAQVFDLADPAGSSSFTTTVTVYDSLGAAHQVDVYFSHDGNGTWTWNAVVPEGSLDGSDSTDPVVIASGTLEFNTEGQLVTETQTLNTVTFHGAAAQELNFDFGEELSTGGDGSGSTSYASPSALTFVDQDGFGVGTLSFIEIDGNGEITGTFSNGQERLLGVIALARFQAPAELNAIGGNLFAETMKAGEPAIGIPDTGGRGRIFSGSLEQSNVDLTNEFTSLIIAQRGFQAASRTISTADEMLIEVVNLKR